MKEKLTIIKVGGKIVEDETSLTALLRDFKAVEGNKILVHGGGRTATDIAARLGIETRMVEGRRITDESMLKVVTMVYAGLVNKNIVAKLNAMGVCALGITGADCNVMLSHRRAAGKVDYGFVGDVRKDSIDTATLHGLLGMGLVPVFCAINHDGQGNLLNTNADTVACAISCAINAKLLYCFEKNGVLYDRFDEESVIPELDTRLYARLRAEGRIADGMIPKLDNAFKALGEGAAEVRIMHAGNLLSESGTRLAL